MQRRYDPAVEKALVSALLARCMQLPEAQRVPEFDAAFGRTPEQLAAAITAADFGSTPSRHWPRRR